MKPRAVARILALLLFALYPTIAQARWYDPGTGSWLSNDPVFGHLDDPMSLNPHLYANGNPTRFTDPTGEAVCYGDDSEACRRLYWQAVRLKSALPSFSEAAVITGAGGEILNIALQGGFDSLSIVPVTPVNVEGQIRVTPTLDVGAMAATFLANKLLLNPIPESNLDALVASFETLRRYESFGQPGSPEFNAMAKGVFEGFSASPTQPDALLDPNALLATDRRLLGLNAQQVELFKNGILSHNQRLRDQHQMGVGLGVLTAAGNGALGAEEGGVVADEAGAQAKTYITYAFTNEKGEVVYVGRASGMGTPEQVLQGRLARGHHIIQAHPELKPGVLAIQGNRAANMGAEEVWYNFYKVRGNKLLNDCPPLSSKPMKLPTARARITAYSTDLNVP